MKNLEHIITGVEWTFEPLEGKDVVSVLRKAISGIKGTYWLSAGTLLGLYRDGGTIPHDTDIDIAVLANTEVNLPKEFELFRHIVEDGRTMQEAYIHRDENIIVDILRYYPLDKNGHCLYNRGDEGYLIRPKDMILPTQSVDWDDEIFKLPADIESYLEIWYDDWETPIKGGKTEWLRL